jgi:type IV secretion system protein VirD4
MTMSLHDVPVLDAGRLRTLPFGQALLLLRSTPPILLRLEPWTRRLKAGAKNGAQAEQNGSRSDAGVTHG